MCVDHAVVSVLLQLALADGSQLACPAAPDICLQGCGTAAEQWRPAGCPAGRPAPCSPACCRSATLECSCSSSSNIISSSNGWGHSTGATATA